jgi:hypothetical protein
MENHMLDQAADDGKSKSTKISGKKRDKFIQLAEKRTKNAMKAIRIIAKLGNKNAYEYSDADVQKIARALTREVESLKAKMTSTGSRDLVEFEL